MSKISDAERSPIGRTSVVAFGLRIVGTGLGFLTAVVLARTLGPEDYGIYSSAMAVATLAAVPVALGFGPLALRETARAGASNAWGGVAGLIRRSHQLVALTSTVAVFSGFIFAIAVGSDDLALPLVVGLLSVPFVALGAVRQGFLQGLHRVIAALTPELVIRPLLALLLALALVSLSQTPTPASVLATYVAACAVSFAVGWVLLRRAIPRQLSDAQAVFQTKRWLQGSLPLMLLSSVTVLDSQVGVLALTVAGSSEDVGHFAVASRLAEFLGFVTLAVNAGAGPTMAQLTARGDHRELRRVTGRCAGLMAGATALLGVGLILCSGPLLQVFGGDFGDSEAALRVLVGGQMLNSLMGPVALLLIMTGNERAATAGVLIGACLNFVLTLILAESFGVVGAAVGRAASMAVWALLLTLVAVRRLGFGAGIWEVRSNRH